MPCAGSGHSCATVASTPTTTCSSATAMSDPGHPGHSGAVIAGPEHGQGDRVDAAAVTALAGQPLIQVERDGVRYTLLGTAHISQASIDAVTAILAERSFDA